MRLGATHKLIILTLEASTDPGSEISCQDGLAYTDDLGNSFPALGQKILSLGPIHVARGHKESTRAAGPTLSVNRRQPAKEGESSRKI